MSAMEAAQKTTGEITMFYNVTIINKPTCFSMFGYPDYTILIQAENEHDHSSTRWIEDNHDMSEEDALERFNLISQKIPTHSMKPRALKKNHVQKAKLKLRSVWCKKDYKDIRKAVTKYLPCLADKFPKEMEDFERIAHKHKIAA